MTGTGRRRRRIGRVLALAAGVLAAGVAAAAATGFGLWPSRDAPTAPADELPPATAQVTRQTLVDVRTETGELSYGATATVTGRLGGTVTALPAVGSTVDRGKALYSVDNTPVVLLYGGLPAYRALSPDAEGADVEQFEQNLAALGYRGFTVDERYTDRTAEAVEEWQEDLELTESGTVELGRVVYAAGPVRVATHETEVGKAAQPAAAVLTVTGTSRVVVVELEVAEQRLVPQGAAVTVTLPDGKAVPGKVTAARSVVDTGNGSGDDAPGDGADRETRLEVTVTVDDEALLAGLDQASVQVAFTADERKDVLTVPVAALLALAEGGYGVQVVEGAGTRIVPVQTGLFAGGRVEVTGEGLAEGTTVGMPS